MILPTRIDFARQELILTAPDGRTQTIATGPSPVSEDFSAVDIDYAQDLLVLHPADGSRSLRVELGVADPVDTGGRPVAYLDQNQWSLLAAVEHGLRVVEDRQRDAASRLLDLANAGEVILPISAGHATETAPQFDVRRVALATTMLGAARGWQMRHPVQVRANELDRVIGDGRFAASHAGVFTRAPGVLWAAAQAPEASIPIPPLDRVMPRLADVASFVAVLRDPAAIEDRRDAADGWIDTWINVVEYLAREDATQARSDEVAYGVLLADLAEDLLSRAELKRVVEWTDASAKADIAQMPYLSRYVRVMLNRVRNRTAGWERNDFIDLMFLPCAAGYADVVIGERRTISDLGAVAARCPPGAELTHSIVEGTALIEQRLR